MCFVIIFYISKWLVRLTPFSAETALTLHEPFIHSFILFSLFPDINECISRPCVNNATCEDGVAGYVCHCLPGWEGVHCEADIDECSPGPCQNGATCTHGIAWYDCDCVPGFTGGDCEISKQLKQVSGGMISVLNK